MKNLLVVVDAQNDFIDGALGTTEAQKAVPNIIKKMREYQIVNNGFMEDPDESVILFTLDTHYADSYDDSPEGKKLPIRHCIYKTLGWQINHDIALEYYAGNYARFEDGSITNGRIQKHTFGSMKLMDIARTWCTEKIELVGFCTDICVISNALMLKAAMPEIQIVVDSSCCAGTTSKMHNEALNIMRSCQIDVI